MRLAIECRDPDIRTGGLAVPSTIPTTIHETTSSSRMTEITMPITMPITMTNTLPITIPNTMPNLLRSYITENPILTEIPTQTWRSEATQLRWQLTTANRLRNEHRIKPFQSIFPTKPYEISRRRSNGF